MSNPKPKKRPLCPLCDRPLTVQVQSSGSIQHVCRTGKRAGDCSYSSTIGGKKRGGQVKGEKKLTRAEIQWDHRQRKKDQKAQGEGDTK